MQEAVLMIDNEAFSISPEMLRRIEAFTLFDDTFMTVVFDDNPETTEVLLRIILNRDDIIVTKVRTQRRYTDFTSHEAVLDVLAYEKTGSLLNVEVQGESKGASPRRARFILALMDTKSLPKGMDYPDLRDNYLIFITEKDVLGGGLPLYQIERTIVNYENKPFNDGSHIIYVNGAYRAKPGEETELSKLIHDFHCAKPEDMYIPALAKAVHEHKYTERGQRKLSNAMKELIEQETAKERENTTVEYVKKMVENLNLTAEQAMEVLALSAEEQEIIKKRLEESR
jgi:predicted transposase/invertase (TIGR01784 family)